jgi:hypothetical protein
MLNFNTTELVIPIHQNLKELLQFIGNPETIVINALRRYLLDVCWQKIELAEQQVAAYEHGYGMNYPTFNQKITTDENFLDRINQSHPMWEADAIEWFYRLEEIQTWQKRLEKVLNGNLVRNLRGLGKVVVFKCQGEKLSFCSY